MQNEYRPIIKICCISSVHEANLAMHAGADAIGLVGAMPSGPGYIGDDQIRKIASLVPPPISTFLLTSETTPDGIIRHHSRVKTGTIQMVDRIAVESYPILREALPGVTLVQVIHVMDEKSVQEAVEAADLADALLLDSGNPNLNVKVLGGTGKTHNWKLSRLIRDQVKIPVWLAGGLHAGNVRQALEEVRPFGLDLCSGVRTAGQLDPEKLEAFMVAACS